ncbi:MAG TPA: GNAT family N-acetyltransferase [Actinomycetota bacterium]|nr:GNAT family N-acetyltransferase [Actinomycetota bacterium]
MAREAWAVAGRAAAEAGVELGPLSTLGDADRILEVMIATWGEHQLVPREMIRALADSGNVPYGAFDDGRLVGYVLGWLAADPGEGLHVHSHMLAALPDRRHRGVGYALKLAQRAQALEQDVHVARWTFDPLVARNAYFNLHKLGAVADRFGRDFYGRMNDVVNRGERTDRFVVRWDLDRAPGPRPVPAGGVLILAAEGEAHGRPGEVHPVDGETAFVQIPGDHAELKAADPQAAAAWRDASALAIERCLAAGLVASAFDRGRSTYVFTRPDRGGTSVGPKTT